MRLNICNFIRRGADLSNKIPTNRCRLLITSNIFIPYYRFHLYYQSMSSSTLRTFTSTSSMSDENRRRQKIYDDIKETSITIPNALCLARIALSPIIGALVINEHFAVALSLFVVAGATDLLDGFIARRYPSQQSLLGSVLDPLADKALVSVLFLTLTYVQLIPLPLTIVIILRDLCLVTGGLWKRYQELSPPKTLSRYFDPSVSKMQVMPTTISKMNTALQLALVAASLASPVFGFVDHYSLQILCWTTAATTVVSGLHYIRVNSMQRVDRSSNKKQQ